MGKLIRNLKKPLPKKAEGVKKKNCCVNCTQTNSLIDVTQDSLAKELFGRRVLNPKGDMFACISCAFHVSLIRQIRSALKDRMKRPLSSCLVCRSADELQELGALEGASDTLRNPLIETRHVSSLINATRKLCLSCAYSLFWLYKYAMENDSNNSTDDDTSAEDVTVTTKSTRRAPNTAHQIEIRSKRTRSLSVEVKSKPDPKNKKVRATSPPRSLRKRIAKDTENKNEESEEPTSQKKARRNEVVPEINGNVSKSKSKRIRKPIERIQLSLSALKNKKEQPEKQAAKAKRNIILRPQRVRRHRQDSFESTEYACSICSEVFRSKVKMAVHEIEHSGRSLEISIERLDMSTVTDLLEASVTHNASSSEEDESGDKHRSRRKSQIPKKTSLQNKIIDENDKRHNFVFVAPLLVIGPKKLDTHKSDNEGTKFGFEKPILLQEKVGSNGDFSEEEDEESENVSNCIRSLDTIDRNGSETGSNKEEDDNTADSANQEETKDNDVDEVEENEPCDTNRNQSISETISDSPKATGLSEEASEGNDTHKQSEDNTNGHEQNKADVENADINQECHLKEKEPNNEYLYKKDALKFDFDDSLPVTSVPKSKSPISINSALSFDFDDAPKKLSKIIPSQSSEVEKSQSTPRNSLDQEPEISHSDSPVTETSLNSDVEVGEEGTMDTCHALREDSVNPTLSQTHDFDSISVTENVTTESTVSHIEKMLSAIVGE